MFWGIFVCDRLQFKFPWTQSTRHFTHYPGWLVLEKYLIENVENTILEPLDFEIFWVTMPPDCIKKLTSTARVFNPLSPASPSWNCASSACKSIDLRPMKWKYCKRNMVQVRLCSRSLVLILSMLVFSPPFSVTRFSAKREEWELRRDSYISLTKYDERVLLNV